MNILIIIAFSLIVFFRSLRFTVITDDVRWYAHYKDGRHPFNSYKWNVLEFVANRLYGGATFLNIKWGFNRNVEIDRAFAIFLHTLICVLLYIATGSLLGAILYCCNPMNNQTSLWLNGRRYAVNIILVLASWIAWQHGLCPMAIALFAYTSYFHMTAVFTPILWGHPWLMLLPLPYAWFKREWIMRKILDRMRVVASKELLIFFPRRIIVVIKSYGFYFWKMIFPLQTMMHYPDLQFWGVTTKGNEDAYSFSRAFYKGVLAVAVSVIAIFYLPPNFRLMAVFAIVSLLQWCNIVYAVSTLADRYANMSLPFVMVILAYFIEHSMLVSGMVIGFYLMSLSITMRMYPIIWDQYKYHIYFAPECVAGRIFFANYYIQKGEWAQAWAITEDGLKYHPNDFRMLFQAAQCWKGTGEKKQAMAYLLRCKENYYEGQEKEQAKAIADFIL